MSDNRTDVARNSQPTGVTRHTKLLRVPVIRVGRAGSPEDAAAIEEPLEIRLQGTAFAVIMRTPGDDKALAAGVLLSEGVSRRRERQYDVPSRHSPVDRPDPRGSGRV